MASALKGDCGLPKNVKVIDTGTSGAYLVNLLNHDPDHPKVLVVVDSGDFRGDVGELRLFSAEDLKVFPDRFSMHAWPLSNELASYRGDVRILLCQIAAPDEGSFKLGLSPKVGDSVKKACDMLHDIIGVNT